MIRARKNGVLSLLKMPAVVLVFLVCVFSIVWLRSGMVNLEYRIGELERKRAELVQKNKSLVAERAGLLSLAESKKKVLGLDFPDRQKVFYVKRAEDVRRTVDTTGR